MQFVQKGGRVTGDEMITSATRENWMKRRATFLRVTESLASETPSRMGDIFVDIINGKVNHHLSKEMEY